MEHRREQIQRKHPTLDGKKPFSWLIFGSRFKRKQLCGNLLKDFVDDGTLTELSECFSRDADTDKKYVQELIRANAQKFFDVLIDDGYSEGTTPSKLFICGNKQMAKDVQNVIEECLIKVGRCSTLDEAKRIIDELVKSGQYIEDIWI